MEGGRSRTEDPLVTSNTMLLAAPTEEEITQKFLLTREVDSQIADVEEEIRLLCAKQSAAKSFIKSTLAEAEEAARELKTTQESLAVVYDASLLAVREKVQEHEEEEEGGDMEESDTLTAVSTIHIIIIP